MERLAGNPSTVSKIKTYLENTEMMESISGWSIRKILKTHLGYRFKSISTLARNSFTKDNIRKLYESVMLQTSLEALKYELVFIDEFSLSTRYNKHFSWAKKGQKGYTKINYDNFSMFFAAAFSSKSFYGVLGTTKPMNSTIFIKFLSQLTRARK